MGIPNSELLAIIAAASVAAEHDLVLDPLGVADGNVFTDYAALLAAVALRDGFVRVFVKSDVTISTGSFGDEVSRIDFVGDLGPGAFPIFTFDGDATHTAVPRSILFITISVSASATASPFVLSALILSLMQASTSSFVTAAGGQPVFRLTDPRVLVLVCRSMELEVNGAVPIVDLAGAGQLSLQLYPPSLDDGNGIPVDAVIAAAGTQVDIILTEPTSQAPHPRDMPGVNAGASVSYGPLGLAGLVIDQADISSNTTIRRPNSVIKLAVSSAFTVTINLSDVNLERGHFFEFDTTPAGADFPVTIALVNGGTFADGSASKTIQQGLGHWRMVRTASGTWAFFGPDGIENSAQGPLHVRPEAVTTNATPLALHTRAVAVNDQVLSIEAIVSGYDTTNNEQYKYRLTGQVKNITGTLTIVANTEVIVEDDATADAVLVVSGTNTIVQVTGPVAKTIEWKSEINYTQVSP